MSKLEELGRQAIVRRTSEQVTLSLDSFDLVYRATEQLGRYFLASCAVEAGVVDFDLNLEAVQELRAALAAIEPDIMELIGWQAASPK
jgi:hypothetical protein